VLAAAPARFGEDDKFKPIAEVTRTRARVLLIWGSRDSEVPLANAERYAAVLSQARVTHRTVIVEGGDHDFSPATPREQMAQRVAEWCRESLAS
jgi:dipeptidyl aminopeptidase/acylaminoacyl peptidase